MSTAAQFEEIVRAHQGMVFRTLTRLLGPGPHVEDLAQDAFLRLFRALPGFRGEALVSTYLYRITLNLAQNEWKRRRREERRHVSMSDEDAGWENRLADPARNAPERMEEGEFAEAVEQSLTLLSDAERFVLVLYHQEEQTYEQIAAVLGMPIGTVRTHLHRGRKKLREALARQKVTA